MRCPERANRALLLVCQWNKPPEGWFYRMGKFGPARPCGEGASPQYEIARQDVSPGPKAARDILTGPFGLEIAMHATVLSGIFIASLIAAIDLIATPREATAASVFQWCPQGRLGWGEAGVPSCGFSSYDQCVAATAGGCIQNPLYNGPSNVSPDGSSHRRRPVR